MRLWVLFSVFLGSAWAEARDLPCYLDVRVYDPEGNPLAFEVGGVVIEDIGVDILNTKAPEFQAAKVELDGSRIRYHSAVHGGPARYIISLRSEDGEPLTIPVYLGECKGRRSVIKGSVNSNLDAIGASYRGRLTGCRFDGDWWVRATPLFFPLDYQYSSGVGDGPNWMPEGEVDGETGAFTVNAISGVRHLLIVGKGRDPVHVFARQTRNGDLADVGTVDLAGRCP